MDNKKITVQEHVLLGQELSDIHERIFTFAPVIWKKSHKKSRLSTKVKNLIQSLTELKAELENELYKTDFEQASTSIYYPKVLTSNSHFENS